MADVVTNAGGNADDSAGLAVRDRDGLRVPDRMGGYGSGVGPGPAPEPGSGPIAGAGSQPPPPESGSPLGPPDLASRFPLAIGIREPTWAFWLSAVCFVSLILFGLQTASENADRGGQGAPMESISVNIVEDPDKVSQNKITAAGEEMPPANPALPPQPAQAPSQFVPEAPEPPAEAALPEPAPPPEPKPEKPPEKPKKVAKASPDPGLDPARELDLSYDALAAELDEKRKQQHQQKAAPKPSPERHAVISGGRSGSRGGGVSGRDDGYANSVINALKASKPPPFAYRGDVLVAFLITPSGSLAYVRIVHSSGEPGLDMAAIEAIRRARFEVPPPGTSEHDRNWLIDYVFE